MTRYFLRTVLGTCAAFAFAYFPFFIAYAESYLQTAGGWWGAFGVNIEPAFVGGIAVSVTGCLTWFESDKEFVLGQICGVFASMSFGGLLMLFFGFNVVHNPSNKVSALVASGGTLAHLTLLALLAITGFAFLTIVQVRRARDRHMGAMARASFGSPPDRQTQEAPNVA